MKGSARGAQIGEAEAMLRLARLLGLNPERRRRGEAPPTREYIAFHEAAHTTVLLAQRLPLAEVRIGRRRHKKLGIVSEGHVAPRDLGPVHVMAFGKTPPETLGRRVEDRRLRKWLAVLLAGPVGDHQRIGKCRGYEWDLRQANDAVMQRYASPTRALVRLLSAKADAFGLLDRHQAAWLRIAEALFERDRLSGDEARALYRADRA
jgi:hypothetical protein